MMQAPGTKRTSRNVSCPEFGKSRHKEGSRFLEFLVANLSKRLDNSFDVFSRHITFRMLFSDFLNEFRLRHQLGHVSSISSYCAWLVGAHEQRRRISRLEIMVLSVRSWCRPIT